MKPQVPEYLIEADRAWLPHRLRLLSRLQFTRVPLEVTLRSTGETVILLSWRRVWFGVSLTLQFADGQVQPGYDPATVRFP